ncbi:Fe(3+)-transporting ATPase [Candidatus Zixiibacteriota bacterium]|nr:Fe(3+)-transporting ATPase [candidate division Zixibacteria bacterium]
MISVRNLVKYYGPTLAVNNVSFEIAKGTVVGFLGPNGAGKSTTVRIITCYLSPTSGSVQVENHDALTDSLQVRKLIGYLPENAPLYLDMNVVDYLKFIQKMRAAEISQNGLRIKTVIERCGLGDVLYKNIGELSKGYRQRVGLAQALVHNPEILILDEPTAGLDPNQIIEIRNLIRELGKEKTIILCSHILPEVEATCNRVLIINEGKIVADGTPEELQASFEGKARISIQVKNNIGPFNDQLSRLPGVDRIIGTRHLNDNLAELEIEADKGTDPREAIFNLCKSTDSILLEMKREEISLEDVFRKLTGREE